MMKALEHLTYMRNIKRWELSLEAEEELRIIKTIQYTLNSVIQELVALTEVRKRSV